MSLSKEYIRYVTITNIVNEMSDGKIGPKLEYEMRNIMERYLISYMSRNCRTVSINDREAKKAVAELIEKKIADNTTAAKHFFNVYVIAKLNRFSSAEIKEMKGTCIIKNNFVSFKDFKMILAEDVIRELKKYDRTAVLVMCMRYASMLSGGQQWSIPREQYDFLYNDYKVRNEGFASPLNSKLMGKPGAHFCSMFLDTDQVFGSIGNFFDANMTEYQNNSWAVNPPFVEDILLRSAQKCLAEADKATESKKSLFVFYIMPAWRDCEAYVLLNSTRTAHKEILKRKTYFYENNNRRIAATFDSAVFVISVNNSYNYSNVCSRMKY